MVLPKHLDEEVMARAAQHFVGTHDFACVRSVGTETKTTVRTVHYFTITREGDMISAGLRGRLSLQYGPGHGGNLRLRLRGKTLPR